MDTRRCERHGEGAHHNCRRVDQVNDLIPDAERAARNQLAELGLWSGDPGYRGRLDRAFVEHMNRLAAERGLRQLVSQ